MRAHVIRSYWICSCVALFGAIGTGEEVRLAVTSSAFPDPSSVQVAVDAGLLGDDEANSPLSGHLVLDLSPSAVNPQTAQITGVELTVDAPLAFRLKRLVFVPAITATADAGAFKLRVVEAALPSEIIDGAFDQFDQLVGIAGKINTSIATEPLDLADQPPVIVDFENIGLVSNRHNVQLETAINTIVQVPVNADGIDANVDILIHGALAATGSIPAARYDGVFPPNDGSFSFGDASIWTRNGIPNTASIPHRSDLVVIRQEHPITLDLEETREVADAEFSGNGTVRLVNGELNVASGVLPVASQLHIGADASLTSGQQLRIQPVSDLPLPQIQLNGQSTRMELTAGTIWGDGNLEGLVVGPEAALRVVPGEAKALQVTGDFVLEGQLQIDLPVSAEFSSPQTLVEYGALSLLEPGRVTMRGSEFDRQLDGTFRSHRHQGEFHLVRFDDSRAVLESWKAQPGDTDGDGRVVFADFLALSQHFGQAGDWQQGDFDGNGLVNFADFLEISTRFGAAAVSVPEPGPPASGLIVWTLFGLFLRQRRKVVLRRRRC